MPDNEDIQAARNQPPGLGLGERLRSARKARALSVAQVAESLRLTEASVEALEDGRFDVMGAPVFVRGHLKRYAQLVGLAPEAVLDAYRAATPDSDAPPSLARRREQSDTIRMGPWAYWLAAALLLVGVIIALSGGEDEPAQLTAPVSETAQLIAPDAGEVSAPVSDGPAATSSGVPPTDAAAGVPEGGAASSTEGTETRP